MSLTGAQNITTPQRGRGELAATFELEDKLGVPGHSSKSGGMGLGARSETSSSSSNSSSSSSTVGDFAGSFRLRRAR